MVSEMAIHFKGNEGKEITCLTMVQKRFVVRALAEWNTPGQVVIMVKDRFGVVMSPQAVCKYNPTIDTGDGLSDELKKLFYASREHFVKHEEQLPMSHLALRLNRREQIYQQAIEKGDLKLAARMLEGAGKEMSIMQYQPDGDESNEHEGE
jgi:hypothetical protein